MTDLGNPAAENYQGSDNNRPVDDPREYDISGNIDPTKASRELVNIGSVYPMTAGSDVLMKVIHGKDWISRSRDWSCSPATRS
jgi:hypothetical protein